MSRMPHSSLARMQALIDQASEGIDGRPLIFWHDPESDDCFITTDAGKWWWRVDRDGDDYSQELISEVIQMIGGEMPDAFWYAQDESGIRRFAGVVLGAEDNSQIVKALIAQQVSPTYDMSSFDTVFGPQRVASTRSKFDYGVPEYAAIVVSSTAMALRNAPQDLIGFRCDAEACLRETHDEALKIVRDSTSELSIYIAALFEQVHQPGTQPVEWSASNWRATCKMLRELIAEDGREDIPRSAQRMLGLLERAQIAKKGRVARIPNRKQVKVFVGRLRSELKITPSSGHDRYHFAAADKMLDDSGRWDNIEEGMWKIGEHGDTATLLFWPSDGTSAAIVLSEDNFGDPEMDRYQTWVNAMEQCASDVKIERHYEAFSVLAKFPYDALAAQAAIKNLPIYDELCRTYVPFVDQQSLSQQA